MPAIFSKAVAALALAAGLASGATLRGTSESTVESDAAARQPVLEAASCGVSTFPGIDDGGLVNSAEIGAILGAPLAMIPIAQTISIPAVIKYETPIQFRITNAVDLSTYNAVAAYHATALDAFGREAESNARRRCTSGVDPALVTLHEKVAVAAAFAYGLILYVPEATTDMGNFMGQIGMGGVWAQMTDPSFDGCSADNIALPWGLAKCTSDEMYEYLKTDGWNADGSLKQQYNKRRYSDYDYTDAQGDSYQQFTPTNNPWTVSPDKDWAPLLESDTKGFFFRQEHVTPYIGTNARMFGLPTEKCSYYSEHTTSNPHYKFRDEVDEVYAATATLAVNETKMMLMESFDGKLTSIALMQILWTVANGYTEFQFWQLQATVTALLYDGVSLVFREKIRWNVVRPTTAAQYYGRNRMVTTWAGPYEGLKTIPGDQWEPYVRTMPHSEYPSASSCLCSSFAEAMIAHSGSDEIAPSAQWATTLSWAAGSSRTQPGAVPSTDLSVTFSTWSSIADECAASRHYGGMHFRASIPAGIGLCHGIGSSVLNKMVALGTGDASARLADFNDRAIDVCPL
jgi:hypothetical protein